MLSIYDRKKMIPLLGRRIAALRQKAGWTQAELARRIHVSTSAVGMYEQGRRVPAVPILVALSREFGVTTDYLVSGYPTPRDVERLLTATEGDGTGCPDEELLLDMLYMLMNRQKHGR